MENFTPISGLIGGALIGLAATLLLWMNGRIAGISGILGGVVIPGGKDRQWRVVFIAGLLLGPLLYSYVFGNEVEITLQANAVFTVIAGLLVGFGTRLGSGCTSGHGICGIARLSRRSVLATGIFMLSALITVFVTRHVTGLL
ncbi:MAG: YeeE/YedE family protein [Gammaproteobacteria bacterium]